MQQATRRRFIGSVLGTAGVAGGVLLRAPGRARAVVGTLALDRTFVTHSDPAFQVSYPAAWRCFDDAVTDIIDPRQLFWISSHPLSKHAMDVGLPNLNALRSDASVLVAWGQSLDEAEHPEHAVPFGDGIRLTEFQAGGPDPGANGASIYQQWFAYRGYGLQIFVWVGEDADGQTAEAMIESIRPA